MQPTMFSTSYTEAPIINGSANLNYTYEDFKKLPLKIKGDFLWFAIVQKGLMEQIKYTEITAEAVETPELFYKVMRTAATDKAYTYNPPKIKLGPVEISSAAQLMTLTGFDTDKSRKAGIPFSNLHYKAEVTNIQDLRSCVHLIGGYNDFDPREVCNAITRYLDLPKFYGETNPNNGNDLLKFEIGREGSPVIYIKFTHLLTLGNTIKVIVDRTGATVHVREYSVEEFIKELKCRVEMFAKSSKGDECNIEIDERNTVYNLQRLEFRVWWD